MSVFDVSGADATVNWNKVQLRPDALGKGGQGCSGSAGDHQVLHR